MRLSRIITTIAVGLAVAAVPTAAGAALSQPQPPPQPTQPPTQPPPYQPPGPSLTVSPSTVDVGEIVTVTGRGFGSREQVEITITTGPLAVGVPGQGARRGDGSTVALAPVSYQRADQPQPGGPRGPQHVPGNGPWNGSSNGAWQVFWIRADDDGYFQFAFRPRHPGTITISARGTTTGRSATAVLTVLRPNQGDDDPLPVTGSSLETPLKVGGGLVGAGVVLLLTTFALRRRNRAGTAG